MCQKKREIVKPLSKVYGFEFSDTILALVGPRGRSSLYYFSSFEIVSLRDHSELWGRFRDDGNKYLLGKGTHVACGIVRSTLQILAKWISDAEALLDSAPSLEMRRGSEVCNGVHEIMNRVKAFVLGEKGSDPYSYKDIIDRVLKRAVPTVFGKPVGGVVIRVSQEEILAVATRSDCYLFSYQVSIKKRVVGGRRSYLCRFFTHEVYCFHNGSLWAYGSESSCLGFVRACSDGVSERDRRLADIEADRVAAEEEKEEQVFEGEWQNVLVGAPAVFDKVVELSSIDIPAAISLFQSLISDLNYYGLRREFSQRIKSASNFLLGVDYDVDMDEVVQGGCHD
jgi:hypothetical protein